jgi:hypothetical protein
MKRLVVVAVMLAITFTLYRVFVTQNTEDTVRRRLDSAVTSYPSYMTATYRKAGSAPVCSGVECEARMEIIPSGVSVTQAEQDLRTMIVSEGYIKTAEDKYESKSQNKPCSSIHIYKGTNNSKLYLTCY